ncbi:MAG: hypothetical protein JXR83_01310 [Deltaproteobacteria bacterium]|nr:hypothetical protein [Deltaproteobacteria bacterium]
MKRAFSSSWIGAVLCVSAVGCGGEQFSGAADGDSQLVEALSGFQTYGPLPADADLSVPLASSIYFGPDWSESISQPLFQGAAITITAHADRFPHCGSAGLVVAFIGYPDGQVVPVGLMEGTPGCDRWGRAALRRDVNAIEIWLQAQGDNCVEWDSQYGANYRFELRPWNPARIRFNADWSEQVEGRLARGGVAVIDYAWERLPNCRIVYRGWESWDIIANAQFDSGEMPYGQSVAYSDQGSNGKQRRLAVFAIPQNANDVALWFENTEYPPLCHEWDSDYGRNYHFSIGD